MDDKLMTAEEAGAYLGVNASRIRQYILEKRLTAERFGKAHMLRQSDLDDLARRLAEEAPRKPGPKPKVLARVRGGSGE